MNTRKDILHAETDEVNRRDFLMSAAGIAVGQGLTERLLAQRVGGLIGANDRVDARTTYWVVSKCAIPATITFGNQQLVLSNGLAERILSTAWNGATTSLKNLYNGASYLHHTYTEAIIGIDGLYYNVGGDGPAQTTFQYSAYRIGDTETPFAWNANNIYTDRDQPTQWPPLGKSVTITYVPTSRCSSKHRDITIEVYFEIYQGMPVIMKRPKVLNNGKTSIKVTYYAGEAMAIQPGQKKNIWIESEYHGGDGTSGGNDSRRQDVGRTTRWTDAGEYSMLKSIIDYGPDWTLAGGQSFPGIRTFELLHSVEYYEQRQMEIKRMYRTLCPWVNDNPICFHCSRDDEEVLRKLIDQCAEVGWEMLNESVHSSVNMESRDPGYINRHKALNDYAHSKGVLMGSYNLIGSNPHHGGPADDYIEKTCFGTSLCLASSTSERYFNALKNYITATGLDMMEQDGPYPMYKCPALNHTYHKGELDSTYAQWRRQVVEFNGWLRSKSIYFSAPDWHLWNGANKADFGYDEFAMSQPIQEQLVYALTAMYNGSYEKGPSMGFYLVPLTEGNQTCGPNSVFQPLSQHLFEWDYILSILFGAGVQACYLGTTLYDSDATKTILKKWTDWFKRYRGIVQSDIVHIKEAVMDAGRKDQRALGMSAILHVNSQLKEKGMLMIHNYTDAPRTETITVPLYYTGLTSLMDPPAPVPGSFPKPMKVYQSDVESPFPEGDGPYRYLPTKVTSKQAIFSCQGRDSELLYIDSNGNVMLTVTLPALSYTWYTIHDPTDAPARG